jgi:hypothetical protein
VSRRLAAAFAVLAAAVLLALLFDCVGPDGEALVLRSVD